VHFLLWNRESFRELQGSFAQQPYRMVEYQRLMTTCSCVFARGVSVLSSLHRNRFMSLFCTSAVALQAPSPGPARSHQSCNPSNLIDLASPPTSPNKRKLGLVVSCVWCVVWACLYTAKRSWEKSRITRSRNRRDYFYYCSFAQLS